MKRRLLLALIFAAVAIAMSVFTTKSYAAPFSQAARSLSSVETSPVIKVEYGCGWDYACPPRPWYGRRSYRTPHVYIENNYGTVNVYLNRRRHHYRPPHYDHPWRWSEGYYESRGYRRCEGDSCEEGGCGLYCWYHRVRNGYCGHGCEEYREHVRFERDYRLFEYPRPYVHRYTPREDYDDGYARFQRPGDDERVPLRRYYGPKYPPNCADGDC